jgi:transposase
VSTVSHSRRGSWRARKQRNVVERRISELKQFRVVATRYDKHEDIFHETGENRGRDVRSRPRFFPVSDQLGGGELVRDLE